MLALTNVPIPYGDFKKHINVLLKCKWQSQWDEAVDNKIQYMRFIHSWVFGLEVLESLGVRRVF